MSCLWMCLGLLYTASFPQSTLQKGVSLKCNQTVVAEAGETVTLNCTIYIGLTQNCELVNYSWINIDSIWGCNSDPKYTCKSDNRTYVSLTIRSVSKEETYNVSILTDCGMDNSSIKVLLGTESQQIKSEESEKLPRTRGTTAILSVFTAMVVFGILCFMFGTERCKNLIRTINTGNSHRPLTPEYSTSSEIFV